jgi:hypothetical protein
MDIPPPDPEKLLEAWMAWERGDETPGQTLANLKKAGMRELLESTVKAQHEMFGAES